MQLQKTGPPVAVALVHKNTGCRLPQFENVWETGCNLLQLVFAYILYILFNNYLKLYYLTNYGNREGITKKEWSFIYVGPFGHVCHPVSKRTRNVFVYPIPTPPTKHQQHARWHTIITTWNSSEEQQGRDRRLGIQGTPFIFIFIITIYIKIFNSNIFPLPCLERKVEGVFSLLRADPTNPTHLPNT